MSWSLTDREILTTPSPSSPITFHLERRQIEWVSTILQPEDTQQETVHTKQHASPQEHRKRLRARILDPGNLDGKGNSREGENTIDGSNNLTLETILVAEATSKIAHTTLAITNNIRRLTNVVEHVARREEQDGNKGDSSPEITVLQQGNKVRPCNGDSGDATQNNGGDGDDLDPVDGARDSRLGQFSRDLS